MQDLPFRLSGKLRLREKLGLTAPAGKLRRSVFLKPVDAEVQKRFQLGVSSPVRRRIEVRHSIASVCRVARRVERVHDFAVRGELRRDVNVRLRHLIPAGGGV